MVCSVRDTYELLYIIIKFGTSLQFTIINVIIIVSIFFSLGFTLQSIEKRDRKEKLWRNSVYILMNLKNNRFDLNFININDNTKKCIDLNIVSK